MQNNISLREFVIQNLSQIIKPPIESLEHAYKKLKEINLDDLESCYGTTIKQIQYETTIQEAFQPYQNSILAIPSINPTGVHEEINGQQLTKKELSLQPRHYTEEDLLKLNNIELTSIICEIIVISLTGQLTKQDDKELVPDTFKEKLLANILKEIGLYNEYNEYKFDAETNPNFKFGQLENQNIVAALHGIKEFLDQIHDAINYELSNEIEFSNAIEVQDTTPEDEVEPAKKAIWENKTWTDFSSTQPNHGPNLG